MRTLESKKTRKKARRLTGGGADASGSRRTHVSGMTATMIGVSAVMLPMSAIAAQWTVQPSISISGGHDDNPELDAKKEGVSSSNVAPRLELQGKTETSALSLLFGGNIRRYSGSVDRADEQRFTARANHRATERSRLGINIEHRRRVLYAYVAEEAGTGDLGDVDTALTAEKVRRDALTVRPVWNYALSERSSLQVGYRAREVDFTNAKLAGLVEYKQGEFSTEYDRRLTTQDNLTLSASHSRYRPDLSSSEGGVDSDTSRLRLGWRRALSETLNGRMLLGPTRTTEGTENGNRDTDGFGAEIGATQRSELTRLDVVVSRDVQPTGGGRAVESDQLRLFYGRRLSQFTGVVVRARTFRNRSIKEDDSGVDRRYIELSPEIQWQFSPDWRTFLGYVYRRQKYDEQDKAAESHAAYLGVGYAPRRLELSR